jgi:2-polyprenyl-6-methoxyphenol hydroxylase-like FAD-dependent oxidoreductase
MRIHVIDAENGSAPTELTGGQAKALILAEMKAWHPALVSTCWKSRCRHDDELWGQIRRADSAPWKTGVVTLLGDAVHNMTPFRGMGANMALRDDAALREALVSIAQGQEERTAALRAYERKMIEQGFAAVNASLAEMRRLHARSLVSRFLSRLVYRTVDMVNPLQNLFRGKRWADMKNNSTDLS